MSYSSCLSNLQQPQRQKNRLTLEIAKIVILTTLHLIEHAKFSKQLTLELLHNSMQKCTSEVLLIQVNLARLWSPSSLTPDRYMNDKVINLVAQSESHCQKLRFKTHDVSKSQVQTH